MLDLPGFVAEKNKAYGKKFVLLVEIEHAPDQFTRVGRFADTPSLTFQGFTWTGYGIGNPQRPQNSSGQIPTFDLPVINAGRTISSLFENNIIEGRPGRLLTVHRDLLSDPANAFEEPFTVVTADAGDDGMASITCAGVKFNWLRKKIPAELVTRVRYPGVLGSRARYA